MAEINGDLYVGQYAAAKIVKVNLLNNTTSDVIVGYKPNFFTVFEGRLYFTSNYTNKLYKLDVSNGQLDIVLNNLNYASGIAMNNELFFMCESSSSTITFYTRPGFQYVSSVQLPANSWPNGVIIIGNELFFVQTISGKISKMPINNLLHNDNFIIDNPKIKIYPNPSSDIIKIESVYQFEKYNIYDIQGKLVENNKLTNNEINISSLTNGEYFLQLDKTSQKFIKN
ncbi:conserved hypothetical protein [Flavobacterium sp. 9AF]|nr:conserved hypothetical protein [Flavobacterium sp. 9AF]